MGTRSRKRIRRSTTATWAAVFTVGNAVAVQPGCSGSTEPLTEYLGIHQVRVSEIQLPDSAARQDTLIAFLSGRPDTGDCFTLASVDVERDTVDVAITMWAEVRRWLGEGPPPPCGIVGYRHAAAPPFVVGWFRVSANQPDGTVLADSVWMGP